MIACDSISSKAKPTSLEYIYIAIYQKALQMKNKILGNSCRLNNSTNVCWYINCKVCSVWSIFFLLCTFETKVVSFACFYFFPYSMHYSSCKFVYLKGTKKRHSFLNIRMWWVFRKELQSVFIFIILFFTCPGSETLKLKLLSHFLLYAFCLLGRTCQSFSTVPSICVIIFIHMAFSLSSICS